MDLRGSLVNTNLKIFPSNVFINFLETITIDADTPINVTKFTKKNEGLEVNKKHLNEDLKPVSIQLTNIDIQNLNKIKEVVKKEDGVTNKSETSSDIDSDIEKVSKGDAEEDNKDSDEPEEEIKSKPEVNEGLYLTTTDIDWLYVYLQKRRNLSKKDIPYLHELLQGALVKTPDNKVLKRNPVLEARCVKLRAQQEAREYRKMTKGVDNVRMIFPEDSISYQLKQLNRQLIAIGQFVISIFAGFLFGFKGIEWTIGPLDFGFRLLLGVMCALVIALAEIYFLAKKLNEELNVPEPVQLGGPTKFSNTNENDGLTASGSKEHQD